MGHGVGTDGRRGWATYVFTLDAIVLHSILEFLAQQYHVPGILIDFPIFLSRFKITDDDEEYVRTSHTYRYTLLGYFRTTSYSPQISTACCVFTGRGAAAAVEYQLSRALYKLHSCCTR